MTVSDFSRYKAPLLVVAALILVWGGFGIIDAPNYPYSGYATDGNNTITRLDAGGPGESAGLAVGDYIRSVGGIPVEDARGTAARGRAEVGDTHTFTVERGGELVSFDLTYARQPVRNRIIAYGAITVGLLFLVFGVWAFLSAPSNATALLAAMGLTFSPAFTVGPYFGSPGVRATVGVIVLLLIVFGFATLTHFLMVFPRSKRLLERHDISWAIYTPAVLVGLLAGWLLLAQPTATSAINVFFRALFALFVVAYFGASLVALIHSFVTTSRQDRIDCGLNMLLIGAVVGLGPTLVISTVGLFAPSVVVPGAQFLPLGLALLPVTFALAAVRTGRSTQRT